MPIDRCANLRALQVHLGLGELLLGGLKGRVGLDCRSREDLLFFCAGGDAFDRCCRRSDWTCLTCRSAALSSTRALLDCTATLEVERVDHIQYISSVHELIIGNTNFDDLPRDLRRHAGNLHAQAAVAGPGGPSHSSPRLRGS